MAEISSTKKNIDLAKREYEKVLITSSYSMTGTWTNVPNWTLTIPLTGRYKFIAAGVMIAYSGTTATNVEAGVRLALNGTFIPGTPKSTGWSSNGATYAYQRVPFEVTWEDNFTAGAVVTLQAAELGGATDCTIAYTSSEDEFYMSYESVAAYVPVVSDTWFTYIPTITADTANPTKGTINTDFARYRLCDGNVLEIYYNYYQTVAGAAGTGYYEWSLPPGFSINNAICPYGTHAYLGTVGQGLAYSSATPEVQVLATANSATTWRMLRNNSTLAWVGSTQYHLNYATLMYAIHLRIPVL